jgi:uncharacterized protein YjeT (DUF2065 family)
MIFMKTLAVLFAIAVLTKLAFILLAPRRWLDLVKPLLANPARLIRFYGGMAVLSGAVVLTQLSIIDVAAVLLFASSLIGLSLIPYAPVLERLGDEVVATGLDKAWLPLAVWAFLAFWVLYAVLQ